MSHSIGDMMDAGGLDELGELGAKLDDAPGAAPRPGPTASPWWERLSRAETGSGDLASYAEDPFNPAGDARWGQHLARGIAGYMGGARRAWADVLAGLLGALFQLARTARGGGA